MDCNQIDPTDTIGTATCSSLNNEAQQYSSINNNYTHQSSPLRKLSIDLIKTYRHINAVSWF